MLYQSVADVRSLYYWNKSEFVQTILIYTDISWTLRSPPRKVIRNVPEAVYYKLIPLHWPLRYNYVEFSINRVIPKQRNFSNLAGDAVWRESPPMQQVFIQGRVTADIQRVRIREQELTTLRQSHNDVSWKTKVVYYAHSCYPTVYS